MMDELPQSAVGKTIMTTQPKFVPSKAVTVSFSDKMEAKVRLVDCVGYLVDGATGHLEGDEPRMVKTPWSDEEMPFEKAAQIGTEKVIREHSTIGIVMTSDGSIDTQIPRASYVKGEEKVINELKKVDKPFVIVLNSKYPSSNETVKLANSLSEKYGACVMPLDVLNMDEDDIAKLLEKVLMEFPLRDIEINIDKWLQALPLENEIIDGIYKTIAVSCESMNKMSDYTMLTNASFNEERFASIAVFSIEPGKGKVVYQLTARPELFFMALSKECNMEIDDEFALMSKIKELAHAKCEYDKISKALDQATQTGYGVVLPSAEQMTLEDPKIVKQGAHYGVKLKASAPSLHIMRVDVNAEVSPVMGAENQSEEMVKNMLARFDGNPKGIWETDMFGKSMHLLVNEGINGKLTAMPEDTQKKMRRTLTRIINEGKGGVICIIL